MSELTEILTARANITRLTDVLMDQIAIAASLSVDRQPDESCKIKVTLVGCTIGTGLVNIAGTTNEALTFSENGVGIGIKDFMNITGITTSGISDGFIEVKGVSKTGYPIDQEMTIHSNLPVRFYAQDGRIRMMKQGEEKIAKYTVMVAPDKIILGNDILYAVSGIDAMTRGQISFVEQIMDFEGLTQHTECELIPL